jgi:hypothetical protein
MGRAMGNTMGVSHRTRAGTDSDTAITSGRPSVTHRHHHPRHPQPPRRRPGPPAALRGEANGARDGRHEGREQARARGNGHGHVAVTPSRPPRNSPPPTPSAGAAAPPPAEARVEEERAGEKAEDSVRRGAQMRTGSTAPQLFCANAPGRTPTIHECGAMPSARSTSTALSAVTAASAAADVGCSPTQCSLKRFICATVRSTSPDSRMSCLTKCAVCVPAGMVKGKASAVSPSRKTLTGVPGAAATPAIFCAARTGAAREPAFPPQCAVSEPRRRAAPRTTEDGPLPARHTPVRARCPAEARREARGIATSGPAETADCWAHLRVQARRCRLNGALVGS